MTDENSSDPAEKAPKLRPVAENEYLGPTAAARELGIHRSMIYQAIDKGNLPAYTVNGKIGISRADIEAYRERLRKNVKRGPGKVADA